jgi:hypothetical protein
MAQNKGYVSTHRLRPSAVCFRRHNAAIDLVGALNTRNGRNAAGASAACSFGQEKENGVRGRIGAAGRSRDDARRKPVGFHCRGRLGLARNSRVLFWGNADRNDRDAQGNKVRFSKKPSTDTCAERGVQIRFSVTKSLRQVHRFTRTSTTASVSHFRVWRDRLCV